MPVEQRSPFGWLRVVLLALLVALVLGVTSLFLFGRAGRKPVKPRVDDLKADADTKMIGRGFDYTYTQGKRPVFRIRGDSVEADKDNTIYLEGVGLTLYDPKGRPYKVESREASYNRQDNEGRLRGEVHLEGPDGLTLDTPVLQLRDNGNLVVTPRPVELGLHGDYVGSAQQLNVHLAEEIYVLQGNTSIASTPGKTPPMSLAADHAIYQRKQHVLQVEGTAKDQAELTRGTDTFKATHIVANLTPDEKSVTFVRALGAVSGQRKQAAAEPGKALLRFRGEDLAVLMQPGTNELQRVGLEGTPQSPAWLESSGGGLARSLTARRVDGQMAHGVLSEATAVDRVVITETGNPAAKGPRRATGDRAKAGFRADGQIAAVDVERGVTYSDPGLAVAGDRGTMNFDSGQGEFFGGPVQVKSERGEVLAPHMTYARTAGLVHADGGVRAVIEKVEDSQLAGSALGGGEGPIRVEAKEGFWRESPRSFLFRGDVRAWRGANLLTAKFLSGEGEPQKLTASGGVKTLWIPTHDEATSAVPAAPAVNGVPAAKAKAKARAASGAGSTGPALAAVKAAKAGKAPDNGDATSREPVEVTAADMVYLEAKRLITYTGDVRVVQKDRTLACQKLDVQLGADKKAETMTCNGQVHLVDPQSGRTIDSQRAVYQIKQKVIEMFGEPVTMQDRDKNIVRGRHMIYHNADGRVDVLGQAAAAPASGSGAGAP
jgi:LPS export ABC transporter protein LptC/lipopolysaccharide transport protein LptA